MKKLVLTLASLATVSGCDLGSFEITADQWSPPKNHHPTRHTRQPDASHLPQPLHSITDVKYVRFDG